MTGILPLGFLRKTLKNLMRFFFRHTAEAQVAQVADMTSRAERAAVALAARDLMPGLSKITALRFGVARAAVLVDTRAMAAAEIEVEMEPRPLLEMVERARVDLLTGALPVTRADTSEARVAVALGSKALAPVALQHQSRQKDKTL
jgi:hypothetical protein